MSRQLFGVTTRKFLAACTECQITRVAVEVAHPWVPSSIDFTFGVKGSAFANNEIDGWPAIWMACEMAGVGFGCGNHNQHQLRNGHGIEPGMYYRRKGCWCRVAR